MRVDALALEDFRNYRRLEAAFSPGVNVMSVPFPPLLT